MQLPNTEIAELYAIHVFFDFISLARLLDFQLTADYLCIMRNSNGVMSQLRVMQTP